MSANPSPAVTPWARLDVAIAMLLGVGYGSLLWSTSHTLGYARDEGFYVQAGESYARYFQGILADPGRITDPNLIQEAYVVNHEHPAFVKNLFALSQLFGFRRWGLFSDAGAATRFVGMAFAGLALVVIYRWARHIFERPTAVVAPLLFGFVPTTFYHSHLACFDIPITSMWLLTAYYYWRAFHSRHWRHLVYATLSFGLALNTKHNSWFLPILAAAHAGAVWLLPVLRKLRPWQAPPKAVWLPWLVGPLVFIAGWPWLWHHGLERFLWYAKFHLGHEYYNMQFLGQTYFRPPFPRGYPWLMTWATLPLGSALLAILGTGVVVSRSLRETITAQGAPSVTYSTQLLWLFAMVINYGPWVSSGTPIFGGTKHWLPAYPFLCLLAAAGFDWLCRTIEALLKASQPVQKLAPWGLAAWFIAPALTGCLRLADWSLAGYTAGVGGPVGAANLGLNRSFWGYTTGSAAQVINSSLPAYGRIYIHDTAWQSWQAMVKSGRLRKDLRVLRTPSNAQMALYHHEPHMRGMEYQIWQDFGTTRPLAVLGPDGVPTLLIYLRPGVTPGER